MATIRKRGKAWQAQAVTYPNGKRTLVARSFPTKGEAERWGHKIERGLDVTNVTLREAMERYRDTVSPKKRGEVWERRRINAWLETWDVVDYPVAQIGPEHIAAYRDARLKEVMASTVNRELNLISHIFSRCVKEWRYIEASPTTPVERPKDPPPRDRVFTDEEIETICHCLGWDEATPKTKKQMTALAFLLALETAMRAGEITRMEWSQVRGKFVHLPQTKNGASRNVPLSKRARELVEFCRGLDETRVLPVHPQTRDTLFRRAMTQACVYGATFHDSRRTATIRLSKKVGPLELAKITGHRDMRILLDTYYGVDPDDLSDKLG